MYKLEVNLGSVSDTRFENTMDTTRVQSGTLRLQIRLIMTWDTCRVPRLRHFVEVGGEFRSMSVPVSNVGKAALILSRFDCRAHSKRERCGCRSTSRRERCVCRVHLTCADYAQQEINAVVECTRQPLRLPSAFDNIASTLGKDTLAHAKWRRSACICRVLCIQSRLLCRVLTR